MITKIYTTELDRFYQWQGVFFFVFFLSFVSSFGGILRLLVQVLSLDLEKNQKHETTEILKIRKVTKDKTTACDPADAKMCTHLAVEQERLKGAKKTRAEFFGMRRLKKGEIERDVPLFK